LIPDGAAPCPPPDSPRHAGARMVMESLERQGLGGSAESAPPSKAEKPAQ
jgi:hypothetical protein